MFSYYTHSPWVTTHLDGASKHTHQCLSGILNHPLLESSHLLFPTAYLHSLFKCPTRILNVSPEQLSILASKCAFSLTVCFKQWELHGTSCLILRTLKIFISPLSSISKISKPWILSVNYLFFYLYVPHAVPELNPESSGLGLALAWSDNC